jgi:peptide/nickel transport system substrate-binding protein
MKALLVAGIAAVAAFAAQPSPAYAQAQNVLRIGLQEDPDVLDPHRARTFVGRIVFKGLCDKLLDATPDLQLVPRLATGWSFSEDGRTLTMQLRAGVTFPDGAAFDANAAKANIDRARTLPDSLRRSEIASIESVEASGPLQLTIRLRAPDATLLSQLADRAGMMMSPATLTNEPITRPICSGPYRFVERVQNDRIVLERFAQHWEAANYTFDRVIYRAIPDTTVRLANLRSGELDMLERLAATDVRSASTDRNLRVMNTPGIGYQGITVNTQHGDASNTPFGRDRRVRQAFSLSLDRNVINQVVFEGTHPPTVQPFPPASPFVMRELTVPARDVNRARALLREAGVTTPFRVELMVTNNPVDLQLGQVIQAMAQEAGFDIQLRAMEFATQLRDQQQGRFQMSRVGWSGRIDPDGNVHPFWTTGGGQNDGRFSNAEVDRLLNEARTIYDVAARKRLYDAAQRIIQEELPLVYLYNQPWYFAMSTRLQGFTIHPDGMIRLAGMRRQ